MDIVSFILSPLGLVFIAVLLIVAVVMVRSVSIGARQQRLVYETLLNAAKRRAHLRVSGVIALRRRAETLRPLFAHLALHGYAKLELVIIIHQTAGTKAKVDIARLGKEYGIAVRTAAYRKGLDTRAVMAGHKKSDLTLSMQASDTFTHRFFEYVSFAFTQKAINAVQVRRIIRPTRTLASAYFAVRTLFSQLVVAAASPISKPHEALVPGTIVRTKVLVSGAAYIPTRVLFDDFGSIATPVPHIASIRSIVAFLLTASVVDMLIMLSPADILAYIASLLLAVLFVVAALTISQYIGLNALQKLQLILVLPLLPLFWFVDVLTALVVYCARAISRAIRHLKARRARQAPQAHTRK